MTEYEARIIYKIFKKYRSDFIILGGIWEESIHKFFIQSYNPKIEKMVTFSFGKDFIYQNHINDDQLILSELK
jgi:hypothetical protein